MFTSYVSICRPLTPPYVPFGIWRLLFCLHESSAEPSKAGAMGMR
nr:MAG TPA: hypothetical protein [Caudoviricetes sp.]